jgi:integrase
MTPAALPVDNDRAKHMLPVLIAWARDRAALLTGMDVSTNRGPARPRHHRGDDVHLRARRSRRGAHRRGLLFAEETLVAPAARKNGKLNEMPRHHKLEGYLGAYVKAAGIVNDRKEPLFRSAIHKTARLSARPILRGNVWRMVRRRAADAGIETAIGCHIFRATGITDYLTNGGRIEAAQRMAGHSNAKTTGIYGWRNDDISIGEVERIGI